MGRLTVKQVEHAKPGRHGDGDGLYLLVSKTGAKSWMIRIQYAGQRRDLGIGALFDLTLEEARDKARKLRKVARAGGDPIAARDKREVTPPSFKEAAVACHSAQAPGWSDKHASAFLSTLELHAFPKIGSLRVDSIDEGDILKVLSPIWTAKPAAARKMRQRLGLVLDFSKGHGWRTVGAPRDSLRALLSKQADSGNFSSMPYEEIPAFVSVMNDAPVTMGRLAVMFAILTAARGGEVREAQWSHIDFAAKEWRRPAALMRKIKRPHTVTLSDEAMEILEQAARLRTIEIDCAIFPGKIGKSLSDMTLGKVVKGTGYHVHGFRSTFRTWAAERMPQIPEPVAEAALSHVVPDKVERAYNRAKFLEMRRTLLDAWGRYAFGTSGDVVHLPINLRRG